VLFYFPLSSLPEYCQNFRLWGMLVARPRHHWREKLTSLTSRAITTIDTQVFATDQRLSDIARINLSCSTGGLSL
jgi:hypothetical protein